jgi:hypothetical protein
MCSGCGTPPVPGHWTDAGGATAADRLRIRAARALVLARVLAPHHLSVRDGLHVPGLTLSGSGGRQVLVGDLDALWGAAARLSGRPVDPLAEG